MQPQFPNQISPQGQPNQQQPSQVIPSQPQQPQVVPQKPPTQIQPSQPRFSANDLPIPGRCGTQAKDRIVGGEETSILDYPW